MHQGYQTPVPHNGFHFLLRRWQRYSRCSRASSLLFFLRAQFPLAVWICCASATTVILILWILWRNGDCKIHENFVLAKIPTFTVCPVDILNRVSRGHSENITQWVGISRGRPYPQCGASRTFIECLIYGYPAGALILTKQCMTSTFIYTLLEVP